MIRTHTAVDVHAEVVARFLIEGDVFVFDGRTWTADDAAVVDAQSGMAVVNVKVPGGFNAWVEIPAGTWVRLLDPTSLPEGQGAVPVPLAG